MGRTLRRTYCPSQSKDISTWTLDPYHVFISPLQMEKWEELFLDNILRFNWPSKYFEIFLPKFLLSKIVNPYKLWCFVAFWKYLFLFIEISCLKKYLRYDEYLRICFLFIIAQACCTLRYDIIVGENCFLCILKSSYLILGTILKQNDTFENLGWSC